MESEDIRLGADPGNEGVRQAAAARISGLDEVAWYRSPDFKIYKLCVLSSEPLQQQGCKAWHDTYFYEKSTFKWKNNEATIKWVEVVPVSCVVPA